MLATDKQTNLYQARISQEEWKPPQMEYMHNNLKYVHTYVNTTYCSMHNQWFNLWLAISLALLVE